MKSIFFINQNVPVFDRCLGFDVADFTKAKCETGSTFNICEKAPCTKKHRSHQQSLPC